eukprot:4380142-Pyramimonas_sp.AAC.1
MATLVALPTKVYPVRARDTIGKSPNDDGPRPPGMVLKEMRISPVTPTCKHPKSISLATVFSTACRTGLGEMSSRGGRDPGS